MIYFEDLALTFFISSLTDTDGLISARQCMVLNAIYNNHFTAAFINKVANDSQQLVFPVFLNKSPAILNRKHKMQIDLIISISHKNVR